MKEVYCRSSHREVCLETDQQHGNVVMKQVFSVRLYHMAAKGTIVHFHYPHQLGNKIFQYASIKKPVIQKMLFGTCKAYVMFPDVAVVPLSHKTYDAC